jgi:hypothetical protein
MAMPSDPILYISIKISEADLKNIDNFKEAMEKVIASLAKMSANMLDTSFTPPPLQCFKEAALSTTYGREPIVKEIRSALDGTTPDQLRSELRRMTDAHHHVWKNADPMSFTVTCAICGQTRTMKDLQQDPHHKAFTG